jgi:protein-S-isoprenylcysteine O-methyltransferase Ste14
MSYNCVTQSEDSMWKIISFLVATVIVVYISRKSLFASHSHGFYRFFAWECIIALFLINVEYWISNPFAWNQIIAWVLLFSSLIPLGFGVRSLTAHGKPAETRETDPSLLAFEKTTQLVTTGIYKYIRHPLYSSLLLLAWGIFFKHFSVESIALIAVTTVFLFFTATADEAECINFFGAEYQDYMKASKRFIPFLF